MRVGARAVLFAVLVTSAGCAAPHRHAAPTKQVRAVQNVWRGAKEQGLAVSADRYYVGYTLSDTSGRIVGYDKRTHTQVLASTVLPTGHTAELADYPDHDQLFVANGGLTDAPARVYVYDLAQTRIVRVVDFSSVGRNAMVAYDARTGHLFLFTGRRGGPWKLTEASTTGTVLRSHVLPDVGTPQGLDVVGNYVYELTSPEKGTRFTRNTLVSFTRSGAYHKTWKLALKAETEGLAYDVTVHRFVIGALDNKIYQIIR